MNIKSIVPVILLLGFLFAGCSREKKQERVFDRKYLKVIKEARQETFFYFTRNFIPGGSIAVTINGKLVWSEGFGEANTDLGVPVSRTTKFRMGKISEVLTTLAYRRMAENKVFDPEESVSKYLPDFPEKKWPLKLKYLVDETSGLRTPTDQEIYSPNMHLTLMNGIKKFAGDTLLFPPGMFQYPTIYSFDLLGAAMEKQTGKAFPQIISEWVTDTLGLDNTTQDNPFITIRDRSAFFDRNIVAQTINGTTLDLRSNLPSCGFLSTSDDLVKLGNALLSSPVLSDTIRNQMQRPALINNEFYGSFGNGLIYLYDASGKKFYASRGLTRGSGAILIILPEDRIVVACMANLNDETEELPGLKVAMMFRDFLHGTFGKKPGKEEKADSARTE